jgi:hypothetical protein
MVRQGGRSPFSSDLYQALTNFYCQQWSQREDHQSTAIAEGTCTQILIWLQR